ncbi:MAG TPA: acyltransferase [Burkholderiaceae bacterium]|nr:acyltransferase [Burkholderiaceae bacterium]
MTEDVRVAVGTRAQLKNERLHSLDGLRAAAATLVVVHHIAVANSAAALDSNGHHVIARLAASLTASGVDLFFVISAIVLARPFMNGRPMRLRTYAVRRLERLFPPYIVSWTLAGVTIALITAYPTWWTATAGLPSFSWESWLRQAGIIYSGPGTYNVAWWSLSIEATFYLLLPLLILLVSRLQTERALYAIFAGSIALAMTPIEGLADIVQALHLYASCFCAGLVLSKILPSVRSAVACQLVGLSTVIAAAVWPAVNQHVGWGLLYFGLAGIALRQGSWLHGLLSGYIFVWLGERSYSLFLVHYPIIWSVAHAASFFFSYKSIAYFVVTRVVAISLSLLVTMLLFQFVERRWARKLATADDFLPRLQGSRRGGQESSAITGA